MTINLAPYVNPAVGLNSTQDIIDLINMRQGDAFNDWQLLVLDEKLQPVNMSDPPNPKVANDIAPLMKSCTVNIDASRMVVRQMQLELQEEPNLQLNTLKHRLQLRHIRKNLVGVQRVDALNVPYGTFRGTLPDRSLSDAINLWSGGWQDLSVQLNKKFWNDYVTVPPSVGTSLIQTLLTADAFPVGRGGTGATPAGCDHVGLGWTLPLALTASPTIMPDILSWNIGDNQGAALAQLTTLLNYWQTFNGVDGTQFVVPNPYQYFDASGALLMPTPEWVYKYGQESLFMSPVVISYPSLPDFFNAVKVICMNNNRAVLTAERWNESPDSIISTVNYKDVKPEVIRDDNIPDQATADARAQVEIVTASMPAQQAVWTGHFNPFVDAHTMLGVMFNAKDGTPEVRVDTNPYEVKQIQLDVMARTQQITAQRVISIGPPN